MKMMTRSMIRLSPDPEGFGETPDKLEAGDFHSDVPVPHTHSDYEDDEIGLYVGLWDTEAMVEAGGPYACDEFMWPANRRHSWTIWPATRSPSASPWDRIVVRRRLL